jgi:hypothetical protein
VLKGWSGNTTTLTTNLNETLVYLGDCGSVHRLLVIRLHHEVGHDVVSGNIRSPDMPLLNHMPHPSQEGLHVLGLRVVPGVVAGLLGHGSIQEYCGGDVLVDQVPRQGGGHQLAGRNRVLVTPPSSPSMDDRQGFQKRVSHRITAPERK